MITARYRVAVGGCARVVVLVAAAAVVCDLLVTVVAYADWRALLGAPESEFTALEDDFRYAITGMGFGVASLLRYLVLAALVVALLRHTRGGQLHDTRCVDTGLSRFPWVFVLALLAVEAGYGVLAWNQAVPSGAWCLARSTTCAISALVTVVGIKKVLATAPRLEHRAPPRKQTQA